MELLPLQAHARRIILSAPMRGFLKRHRKLVGILGGFAIFIDNIGRVQTIESTYRSLKQYLPTLLSVRWPSHLLTYLGAVVVLVSLVSYFLPERMATADSNKISPKLIASTFSAGFIASIQKGVFLVHVRNDAESPLAVARNVVVHIGYRRPDGHGMLADYGAWMENAAVINIERGQTKRLIVALTDGGKNFAVNFTGPRNNFVFPELVSVGELTQGDWMMVIKVNAEDYKETFYFVLTVEQDGSIACRSVTKLLW